jgi:Recombination endonuclease VII
MPKETTPFDPPNPSGLCWCGCRATTSLAKETNRSLHYLKGHPVRYIVGHARHVRPPQPGFNPSGRCMCGCGQLTPLASKTMASRRWVKGEPTCYVAGHGSRKTTRDQLAPPNPSGFCQCGCGEQTRRAKMTDVRRGFIEGEYRRYVRGHQWRRYMDQTPDPNPSGLCQCGCGQLTLLAKYNNAVAGTIKGKPSRYLPGHSRIAYPVPPEGSRWCRRCQQIKPDVEFRPSTLGARTRSSLCIVCLKLRESQPDWVLHQKDRKLRTTFGITLADYEAMRLKQGDLCAICKNPEWQKHQNGKVKQLSVDHDHATGKVRGLLCHRCNHALERVDTHSGWLQAAAEYVRRYG